MKIIGRVYVHEQRKNRLNVTFKRERKKPTGGYELLGYDPYVVWLSSKLAGEAFEKGDVIEIEGSQSIRQREYNGKTYTDVTINVWKAERVLPDQAAGKGAGSGKTSEEPPPYVDADAPPLDGQDVPF